MKKIGFFEELQPNGRIAFSTQRVGFIILMLLACYLVIRNTEVKKSQSHEMMMLMKETIKTTTYTPSEGKLIETTTEKPIMTPIEYGNAANSLPEVPWEGVLFILGFAITGKVLSKGQEVKKLDANTPGNTDPPVTGG